MLLAERAGRKLEPWSNSRPRGMAVITGEGNFARRNRIRPIGLLHFLFLALRQSETPAFQRETLDKFGCGHALAAGFLQFSQTQHAVGASHRDASA